MSAQAATRELIGDDDIRLESMHLEGLFTLSPEIGSGGRKNTGQTAPRHQRPLESR